MVETIDDNVKKAFKQIQQKFTKFDSMHNPNYLDNIRIIEKRCELQTGTLEGLFGNYCTISLRQHAQRIYNNRTNKKKIPQTPYKRKYLPEED